VAVGAAGTELRPDLLELKLGPATVMLNGVPNAFDQNSAIQAISGPEAELTVDLHMGAYSATVWTSTTPMD
jgi:glutamate N-acetyltransferase / amino-acid N-acetyltransferase